jgi:hypothetical protein
VAEIPLKQIYELAEILMDHRERQRATSEALLAHRLAMKGEIGPRLEPPLSGGALEIIVRDFQRLDRYPGPDDSFSGISPWFKVLLVGTFDGGVEVVSHPVETIVADGMARRSNDPDAEVLRPGNRIPYERIIQVDWSGDNHYSEPQFYCAFSRRSGPYLDKRDGAYRHHDDHDHYERLEDVVWKRERRSLRGLWDDWRLHQAMLRDQREFTRQVRAARTDTRHRPR